ncbi:MAG: 2-oxo acid dehydrogenase subunit E2 [Polyangiaceae bacterium]|nr:2-oxo acid dehydrogenase subunit E2 [Polyangiaceae bacterium]
MSHFRRLERVSSWRRMALEAWAPPSDPTVYGILEVPAAPLEAHVARLREASGKRVTLTHLIGKAAALAIAARPETNSIVRRGRLWQRDTIDVFFQVAFEGGENLAGAKVCAADRKGVLEIADELAACASRIRDRRDDPTVRSTRTLARLPPRLLRAAMRAGETLSYDYGVDLSRLGIPYDAIGSCMITNVAGFGLEVGLAPLFPPGRCPMILTVGAVRERPAVVAGQVVAQRTLVLGAAFDHRVADGYQAGRLAGELRAALLDPATRLA